MFTKIVILHIPIKKAVVGGIELLPKASFGLLGGSLKLGESKRLLWKI